MNIIKDSDVIQYKGIYILEYSDINYNGFVASSSDDGDSYFYFTTGHIMLFENYKIEFGEDNAWKNSMWKTLKDAQENIDYLIKKSPEYFV